MEQTTLHKAISSGNSENPIIDVIDVGFGYTKFGSNDPALKGEFHIMPSIAPEVSSNDMKTEGNVLNKRDTAVIEVNGKNYEVGPDAAMAQKQQGTRLLGDNYIETDEHLALLRGALHYLGHETVDMLIVGLPVKKMRHQKTLDKLKEVCIGEHSLPDGKKCTVKEVVILVQPIGGFLEYAFSRSSINPLANERTLVVDPGQKTFDWVTCEGMKPIESQCDNHNNSMRKIISQIETNITNKLSLDFDNNTAIERAISEGTIRINRIDYPITDFIDSNVKLIIKDAVNSMFGSLDNRGLIENIIVVGGAGYLFKKALQEVFPSHDICISDSNIFSNIKGYLIYGVLQQKQKQKHHTAAVDI